MLTELGQRLRAYRKEADLSQYDLAERSGVPRTQIQGYEEGRHLPSVEILCKLADALGCTADALLGRAPTVEAQPAAKGKARTVEEAQAQADEEGKAYFEHEGKAYRRRRDGWEPVG